MPLLADIAIPRVISFLVPMTIVSDVSLPVSPSDRKQLRSSNVEAANNVRRALLRVQHHRHFLHYELRSPQFILDKYGLHTYLEVTQPRLRHVVRLAFVCQIWYIHSLLLTRHRQCLISRRCLELCLLDTSLAQCVPPRCRPPWLFACRCS